MAPPPFGVLASWLAVVILTMTQSGLGPVARADPLRAGDAPRPAVFKLLAEGKTSREISRSLNINLKTAMTHRSNLMGKLGLHSRAEVVRFAIRRRIIEP